MIKLVTEFGADGGGELPAVTAADDGKVLTVIDGEWGAGEASGGGVQVIDVDTLTVPTYNGVEIDSLYVSYNGALINMLSLDNFAYVGDAPEGAVIFKTQDNGRINYSLAYSQGNVPVDGLTTSEGSQHCITNDVTISAFECSLGNIYFIPATAVIAPFNYEG